MKVVITKIFLHISTKRRLVLRDMYPFLPFWRGYLKKSVTSVVFKWSSFPVLTFPSILFPVSLMRFFFNGNMIATKYFLFLILEIYTNKSTKYKKNILASSSILKEKNYPKSRSLFQNVLQITKSNLSEFVLYIILKFIQ